eukprot:Gb_40638 [translate_table: standard]
MDSICYSSSRLCICPHNCADFLFSLRKASPSLRRNSLTFPPAFSASSQGLPEYHLHRKRLAVLTVLNVRSPQKTQAEQPVKEDDSNIQLSSSSAFEFSDSMESLPLNKLSEKAARRKVERYTYLFAALASTVGITTLAAGSVYYRFAWQMQGGDIPFTEMFGTFALAVGATVGMEAWARWAHRALWHASLWFMHESHHRPREGPFELNDVFAITNAVPAIALLAYGFHNKGLVPGLCFGALHHADKFNGVPYGLFLGPKELEEVGGIEELDKLFEARNKKSQSSTKL